MYLWKIERTDDVGYEQNEAHVIAAEDELMVREIAASAATTDEGTGGIWYAPTTKVVQHGVAYTSEAGIILTSNRGA